MSKYLASILVALMLVWVAGMTYQIFGFETISEKHHRFGVVSMKKEKTTGALYRFDCSPIARGCMVTKQ